MHAERNVKAGREVVPIHRVRLSFVEFIKDDYIYDNENRDLVGCQYL